MDVPVKMQDTGSRVRLENCQKQLFEYTPPKGQYWRQPIHRKGRTSTGPRRQPSHRRGRTSDTLIEPLNLSINKCVRLSRETGGYSVSVPNCTQRAPHLPHCGRRVSRCTGDNITVATQSHLLEQIKNPEETMDTSLPAISAGLTCSGFGAIGG